MVCNFRAPFPLISIFVWLLSTKFSHAGIQSDIDCLRAIKGSLKDSFNYLASWDFTNATQSSVCNFMGIECWPDKRVLNIKLAGKGLAGEFPLGVINCTSLVGLDLSNNDIHGCIPNNISNLTPFVTYLDLSCNKLSGGIPPNLANCTFLNLLKLNNNQLNSSIPAGIGLLHRMRTFNVSNNLLTGRVPIFVSPNATIGADSYANNKGLCGGPLPRCPALNNNARRL